LVHHYFLSKKSFNSSISKEITDYFIDNSVHLIYSSTCGACHSQIELFNDEDWFRYVKSGLAVDCNEEIK